MEQLDKIIDKLKSNNDIDAIFITGSYGTKESKPYSDIDLVIILKENKNNLYSVYRWIDGTFADIFFFDLNDLERISDCEGKYENLIDSIFVSWLKKADIKFDKSGILSKLKNKTNKEEEILVSKKEKNSFWQKINYNFVANKRYFESNDILYLKALEMRLLYSVIEVICGYITLRNISWRGEKDTVKYLENNHPEFYILFDKYTKTFELDSRFNLYSQMVDLVFTDEYKKWTKETEVIIRKDFSIVGENNSVSDYVKSLF